MQAARPTANGCIRSETLKLCRDISTENSEMSTTPCSVYDTVQPAFAVNNLSVLKECWADLLREIDAISESSIEQFLCAMSSTDHSLRWLPTLFNKNRKIHSLNKKSE